MLYLLKSYKLVRPNPEKIIILRIRFSTFVQSLTPIVITVLVCCYTLLVRINGTEDAGVIEKVEKLLFEQPLMWLVVFLPILIFIVLIPLLIKAIFGEKFCFNRINRLITKNSKELSSLDSVKEIIIKYSKGSGDPARCKRIGLPIPTDLYLLLKNGRKIKIIRSEKYEYVQNIANDIAKFIDVDVLDEPPLFVNKVL